MQSANLHQIFHLPELLEAILLRVPPVTVQTTCRLVCRHWKIMIHTTPALKYYTSTGLWIPDQVGQESSICQPLPEPFSAFTPMALDILQIYWKKLDAMAIKAHEIQIDNSNDESKPYRVWTPTRLPLVQKICQLLIIFRPICDQIQLLRPEFTYIKHKKFSKNWVALVYNSAGEIETVRKGIPESHPNPLYEILAQMGLSIWNASTSDSYDYNPDAIIPRHPGGSVKAYLLFIFDYKARESDTEMRETRRKDKEELLRQEDRKRVKQIIRERSLRMIQEGLRGLDDDLEEDVWEEDERAAHALYEKEQGSKIFRELLRFGDYPPHRPVVVIRGTNYGYT